jgi:hypothetical protein
MSTGIDVRTDGWDIRGRWFGVVVAATPRLGELRRGETIPWRVMAAQIAPRERRSARWPEGAQVPCYLARLRALRLSRVQSIFGGTTEIMKEIVGRAWACNPDQALYEANALGS